MFHQISTRILPGFHQVLRAAGWSEVHQVSTRVPPACRGSTNFFEGAAWSGEGSTRVPPGFHQGSTSGPGWFEVMFHENSTRISPGFAR